MRKRSLCSAVQGLARTVVEGAVFDEDAAAAVVTGAAPRGLGSGADAPQYGPRGMTEASDGATGGRSTSVEVVPELVEVRWRSPA